MSLRLAMPRPVVGRYNRIRADAQLPALRLQQMFTHWV
jgi:hypothetical protein